MLISAISSSASGPVLLNPATPAAAKPASSSATATAASSSTAAATTPAASASESTAPARTASGHASGGSSAAAASAAAEAETLVGGYSATIGGTQYSGSVEQSGAEYTASVPNVPGATATGSSMIAAENALTIRIDELV